MISDKGGGGSQFQIFSDLEGRVGKPISEFWLTREGRRVWTPHFWLTYYVNSPLSKNFNYFFFIIRKITCFFIVLDFLLPFFFKDLSLPKYDEYVFVNANSIIFVQCHKGGEKSCNYCINALYKASTFNVILCHIDTRAFKFPHIIVKLKK